MKNQAQIRTTCPYCGVGCGLIADVAADGDVAIKGDPEHPANFGRLCSKGAALAETIGLDGRLLHPMVDGCRADWDHAVDAAATRLRTTIERYGPDAVAFYVSGQLLTEDYYVANKLMKGFIGAANIDTNSRLCMSSAVSGYKRAFGSDTVPCSYEDLELAELVVLVGSNMAWCHPVLYRRLVQAKEGNPRLKVVVIDPRRTDSCDIADLHLPLAPGSDAILFNGLLHHLQRAGKCNDAFVGGCTRGVAAALAAAHDSSPDTATVAARCGLAPDAVAQFFDWFAAAERVVTAYSQGVNQSSSGTDKSNAIINCHLFTGRIGAPGAGPFSITGQPNAMGGREVGGLANQLAAHMDFTPEAIARVARFWRTSGIAHKPGLTAVEMFDAVERGEIKAIWIMATNPVVSMPDADHVRRALQHCPVVIVSDCMADTDTVRLAHIRLPALAWGEKEGSVTNSERRISRQRAFLPPPGDARPDWWIVSQVARRLGHRDGFAYRGPAEIFREHAALSAFENGGMRDFDIGACAALDDGAYHAMKPFRWPAPAGPGSDGARLFADGRFYTADGRARFIAVAPRPSAVETNAVWPLILNTGRMRDQWHTMTRSGKAPRLSRHSPEPHVQIHPMDARRHGVDDGALACVQAPLGKVIVRVRIDAAQRPGSLFVPIHWNSVYASCGRVGTLIPAHTDPISGQPELKQAPVTISPYRPEWHGFLISRRQLQLTMPYWVRARDADTWNYVVAGEVPAGDWSRFARELLCDQPRGDWIEYFDDANGIYRAARLVNGRLESCLFVTRELQLPSREWLETLFLRERLGESERIGLLSARAPGNSACAIGNTVCACHGVGEATIRSAIRGQGCNSVQAIGAVLKAGTQCGSCVPELKRLLSEEQQRLQAV